MQVQKMFRSFVFACCPSVDQQAPQKNMRSGGAKHSLMSSSALPSGLDAHGPTRAPGHRTKQARTQQAWAPAPPQAVRPASAARAIEPGSCLTRELRGRRSRPPPLVRGVGRAHDMPKRPKLARGPAGSGGGGASSDPLALAGEAKCWPLHAFLTVRSLLPGMHAIATCRQASRASHDASLRKRRPMFPSCLESTACHQGLARPRPPPRAQAQTQTQTRLETRKRCRLT